MWSADEERINTFLACKLHMPTKHIDKALKTRLADLGGRKFHEATKHDSRDSLKQFNLNSCTLCDLRSGSKKRG